MNKFKWTVEFAIDESWVADGFELTEGRAKDMIEEQLPYAYGFETSVKIIKTPPLKDIWNAQGYASEEAYRKDQAS